MPVIGKRLTVERPRAAVAIPSLRVSGDAAAIGALLALTAVVAWDRLHRDRELSWTDTPTFYMAWYAYLGEQLRSFDLPGWNPHLFAGTPFLGDPQSGWMYLPAMLFFTLLPAVAAFKAFVAFHLVLAGVSAYVLGRMLGLGVTGAVTAGVAYEFGPFVKYTACCTSYAQVAAWIPLGLIGVELAFRAHSWPARVVAWGVAGLAISQQLAGWLGQGAYYGLLLIGSYVAFRALIGGPADGRGPRQRVTDLVVHGAGVLGVGFGLAAAGIFPRLDAISRSTREGGTSQGGSGGHDGWPWAVGLDRVLSGDHHGRWYLGATAVALALLAPLLTRERRLALYLSGLSFGVFLLALHPTPLHDALFLLPRFQVLHQHVPNRVLLVLGIGPALLAGMTVHVLARRDRGPRLLAAAAILPLVLFVAADVYTRRHDEGLTRSSIAFAAIVAASLLALAAVAVLRGQMGPLGARAARWAPRIVPLLLVALIFWDQTGRWYGGPIPGVGEDPRAAETVATYADRDAAGAFLQARWAEKGPVRYAGYDPGFLFPSDGREGYRRSFRNLDVAALLVNNRAMWLDLHDLQGYNPVQVQRYVDLMDALNGRTQDYHEANLWPGGLDSPLLNLLGVRYLVAPRDVPPGRPDLLHLSQRFRTVFANERVRVLENPDAFPRAWLVHEAREVSAGEGPRILASGAVDPRQVVLLEAAPPPLAQSADAAAESVTVDLYEPDRVRLAVESGAAGMVVLGDVYDPGWTATVDGEPVTLYAADHALRAIPVPAGSHTVELTYQPPDLAAGLALSLGTLAVIVAAVGIAAWRRRGETRAAQG